MNKLTCVLAAAAATASAALLPTAASAAAPTGTWGTAQRCVAAYPGPDFYAGGRIASTVVHDRNRACSTISVSHIRDAANPSDTCQTFLVALLRKNADPTYTEPVQACSPTPGQRTVLATGVPVGTQFRVIYQIDYLEPAPQRVLYTVWH